MLKMRRKAEIVVLTVLQKWKRTSVLFKKNCNLGNSTELRQLKLVKKCYIGHLLSKVLSLSSALFMS